MPAVHPENWATEAEKATSHSNHARQTPELLGPGTAQNAVPAESEPLRATWAPNLSGLDRGGARSLGLASDGSRLSIVELERFVCREKGQVQRGWDTVCTQQCYLFAASPPPHSATELVSLKNQQTEEVKQREPPWKWSHTAHNIRKGPGIFLLFLKSFLFFFSFWVFKCTKLTTKTEEQRLKI